MSKIPITLTIDPHKKVLFESLKDLHGKNFSELLEESLVECLSKISPVALVEEKISQTKILLIELEKELLRAKAFEEQMKLQQKASTEEENSIDAYREDMRNQRFEEGKKGLIVMWKKSDMNWPRIVENFQFKNQNEAKEWFAKKMMELKV